MGKSRRISQYRERLDRSLASADLKDHNALEALVRSQLQYSSVSESEECSEDVVVKRTGEVSNFIDMLKGASVTDNELSRSAELSHAGWKLKDDNEEYRVMYRPGPEGSPFHSLLVEGCIDGPIDVCLCISWEAALYGKWWPQFTFPPFKIIKAECLQRIRLGEQVCLVRVKVPWPMSSREAVVHYYMFEYLQDDLIILLFNTIPDIECIDKSTHGFTKDGIPEAKEVVRIDLVGGVALQKVTAERSYFRTITSMDMKLDFVPPALINFISRQLIGSGFRLYQKTVASLSSFDPDYSKVLEDPMYAQMRKAFFHAPEPNEEVEGNGMNGHHAFLRQHGEHPSDACPEAEEQSTLVMQTNSGDISNEKVYALKTSSENVQMEKREAYGEIEEEDGAANWLSKHDISNGKDHVAEVFQNTVSLADESTPGEVEIEEEDKENDRPANEVYKRIETDDNTPGEIEEENKENGSPPDEVYETIGQTSANTTNQKNHANYRRHNTSIRPEVKQALETLEKAISLVRKRGHKLEHNAPEVPSAEEGNHGVKDPSFSEDRDVPVKATVAAAVVGDSKIPEMTSHESRRSSSSRDIRRAGSSSSMRETNHNKVAPASPEQHQSPPDESIDTHCTTDNGVRSDVSNEKKQFRLRRNYWFCCFVPAPHE